MKKFHVVEADPSSFSHVNLYRVSLEDLASTWVPTHATLYFTVNSKANNGARCSITGQLREPSLFPLETRCRRLLYHEDYRFCVFDRFGSGVRSRW